MEQLSMAAALNLGLRRAMTDDPKVVLAGEDIGRLGGVFRVTQGLQEDFGPRVMDSLLAESGIVGTAIGLALRGYRPVVEIQFDGFAFPAFNQLITQAARFRTRTAGHVGVPLVVRVPYGGGIGSVEHHSESPEAYFCHTPGLTVVTCSTPQDAHGMIQQAIRTDDPVIFLEPKRLYHQRADVDVDLEPPPLHQARVRREGTDLTLVCYGPTVDVCLRAADVAAEEGRSLEVLDLRSLSPVDWDGLTASVRRTGRAVVVHEAHRTLGLGAELAARLHQDLFYEMTSPVLRVTGYDVPYPHARVEHDFLPDVDRVLDAVDESFSHEESQ